MISDENGFFPPKMDRVRAAHDGSPFFFLRPRSATTDAVFGAFLRGRDFEVRSHFGVFGWVVVIYVTIELEKHQALSW